MERVEVEGVLYKLTSTPKNWELGGMVNEVWEGTRGGCLKHVIKQLDGLKKQTERQSLLKRCFASTKTLNYVFY